jgi:signal transduction histidine kinase
MMSRRQPLEEDTFPLIAQRSVAAPAAALLSYAPEVISKDPEPPPGARSEGKGAPPRIPRPGDKERMAAERDSCPSPRLSQQLTQREVGFLSEISALKASNEEKVHLLRRAAHDLCQPLSVILFETERVLEERGATWSGEQRQWLEAVLTAGKFMQRLTTGLLEMADLESRGLQLARERTDWLALVEQSVSFFQPLAHRKQVGLSLHARGPLPAVAVDPRRISQVFHNLLENAVKYCPEGGQVDVHVWHDGNAVLVAVKDNGPGIPADELQNLFTPFQTTRASAASSQGSTGLGLTISRRIVELHNGKIWAESVLGQGAAFYVSVPSDLPAGI